MEEIDLKELIQMFWEKKVQIILIIAIFGIVVVMYRKKQNYQDIY